MDLIDSKYIGLVSPRLQKFKRVKPNLYNFRCPICGDSQKHKNKARGYFYQYKTDTNFKCHNCGASSSFNNLNSLLVLGSFKFKGSIAFETVLRRAAPRE